jgi:hypothetical protein
MRGAMMPSSHFSRRATRAARAGSIGAAAAALVAGAALPSCSSETVPPGPAPSSTSAPEAPPSPFAIVLQSAKPVTFAELSGGVAVADSGKAHLATAATDGELASDAMPAGLPEETGSILRLAGKHPGSLWLTYEIAGDGKKAKHPLLRLDVKKKQWKEFADDWRPMLGVWSKGRIVAASTSSGKLKIKVMEPHSKKAPPDLPNPALEDAECDKSLRVEALWPLANGAVWMAGTCKPAGAAKRRHVALFWAPFDEAAAAAASASASAKASAKASAPSLGATSEVVPAATESASAGPSAAPSGTGSTGAAEEPAAGGEEAEEPRGPKGKVLVLPAGVGHRSWAVRSERDAWVLGEGEKGTTGHLHHWTGEKFEEVALPALEGAAVAVAVAADGTLWLASEHAVFKQAAGGAWEPVPLPNGPFKGSFGVTSAPWDVSVVSAVGKDVWAAAKVTLPSGDRHVVLRLRPAPAAVSWQ